MDVRFRAAELADADLVVGLMREYYAFDHLPFDGLGARKALRGLIADRSLGGVWVISVDDETAGYAVLTLGYSLEYLGRDAFVDEIYLREACRGRGVGRQALDFLEDVCRSLGVRALHLEVERANVSAREVYRKSGFVDHDRHLMTRRIG